MSIQNILKAEESRQLNTISLIASENIASLPVRAALSSVLTNKYAEGYPGRRYYAGCEHADEIEIYAIELVKKIFNCKWANVQPHSGSQANQAVFLALLNPGDTILSLSLEAGGHLTHGAKVSATSRFYNIVHYSLDSNGIIDMQQVEELARKHKPKLIITGASGYPRLFDWPRFRKIANEVGAYLMADIAHTAGLVAGGAHVNPVEFVDIITSTTHKTLRGPRGGIILSNNEELGAKIDRALFPGVQGGPLMNIIAAKAVAFEENLQPEFKTYAADVLKNAQILAKALQAVGGKLVTDGTDNHLMILDCRSFQLDGKSAEKLLCEANVLISVSALLDDTSWIKPSGIRLGTPYITTLGVNENEMHEFCKLFVDCLQTKNATKLKEHVVATANRLYPQFL